MILYMIILSVLKFKKKKKQERKVSIKLLKSRSEPYSVGIN